MKKIVSILLAFMLTLFVTNGQSENVSKTMGSNDSVTVSVKFERVKLTKEETNAQSQFNALLANSVTTTDMLSTSIDRLTTAIEQSIALGQQTKIDIVSMQMGVSPKILNQAFKRNNTIKLIALIPALMFIFWSMGRFLNQKGLDIKHILLGTAVMALYALIGSGVLYAVGSLIFNKQYFVIKDLMSALF
jgi:hypothetical protein